MANILKRVVDIGLAEAPTLRGLAWCGVSLVTAVTCTAVINNNLRGPDWVINPDQKAPIVGRPHPPREAYGFVLQVCGIEDPNVQTDAKGCYQQVYPVTKESYNDHVGDTAVKPNDLVQP